MIIGVILALFVSFIYLTIFSLCRVAGKEDEYYERLCLEEAGAAQSLACATRQECTKIQALIEINSI